MNKVLKNAALLIPPIKRQYAEMEKLRNTVSQLYDELSKTHAVYASAFTAKDTTLRNLNDIFEDNISNAWKNGCAQEKYVCTQPFNRIEIDLWGNISPCCPDYLKPGLFVGKAFETTLESMWNSDAAKRLRYSVSKGRYEYCNHSICPMLRQPEEYPDIMIPREKWARDYQDWRDCSLDTLPSNILLSCDATCNLQCPSCRDGKLVNSAEKNVKLSDLLEHDIRPALKDCTQLSALGYGEFFASKLTIDFFKTFSQAEYPNMKINIITNGTLFTPENWSKLQNLKGMVDNVSVSIDAAEKETYEKLRLGGSWEVLCDNMEFISSLKASGEISRMSMNFVVQADNFRQMKGFVALGKKWNTNYVTFQRFRNFKNMDADALDCKDVFSPKHPHYEEASRLLEECKAETGVTVLYNV